LKPTYGDDITPGASGVEKEMNFALERLGLARRSLQPKELARQYRSALSARKMLIVLDEPAYQEQIIGESPADQGSREDLE
jgi:hypothetical protein